MMGQTSPLPQGAPLTLMTLRVSGSEGPRFTVPERLSSARLPAVASAPVRRVPLTFMQMTWLMDGRVFDMTTSPSSKPSIPAARTSGSSSTRPTRWAW
jgi:hypothetical protein